MSMNHSIASRQKCAGDEDRHRARDAGEVTARRAPAAARCCAGSCAAPGAAAGCPAARAAAAVIRRAPAGASPRRARSRTVRRGCGQRADRTPPPARPRARRQRAATARLGWCEVGKLEELGVQPVSRRAEPASRAPTPIAMPSDDDDRGELEVVPARSRGSRSPAPSARRSAALRVTRRSTTLRRNAATAGRSPAARCRACAAAVISLSSDRVRDLVLAAVGAEAAVGREQAIQAPRSRVRRGAAAQAAAARVERAVHVEGRGERVARRSRSTPKRVVGHAAARPWRR